MTTDEASEAIEERGARQMQEAGASPEEVQAWRANCRDALSILARAWAPAKVKRAK